MTPHLDRRAALGLGAAAAAGAALGPGTAEALPAQGARRRVGRVYRRESARAGGVWNAYVTVVDRAGTGEPAVDDKSDAVVQAYSVNKVAVATAVLDKIDRGLLTLGQRVDVTADIVSAEGDGIFRLDRAYPSSVTLGHVLAALLSISDDTAVRLCGLVCTAAEVNETLAAKGFPKTQVRPTANPHRFFLGTTTPREMHDLLRALVNGTLLATSSTDHLLGILRSPIAFTDGIRRVMSSAERLRIATKAGWFADGRNEAGIMFDTVGLPVLTYSLFAHGQAHPDDFGATHPAVQARSVMGRTFLDAVSGRRGVGPRAMRAPRYRPLNGG
jgi:beta-lactamase class A